MSTPQLTDLYRRFISPSCKQKRHTDCDGIVYGKEWNDKQHDCNCICHRPPSEAQLIEERIARSARRKSHKRSR